MIHAKFGNALQLSITRVSENPDLRSLVDSSSRSQSYDDDSVGSGGKIRTTSSQVTEKASNSLTSKILQPIIECGNVKDSSTPRRPILELSPRSNRDPVLFPDERDDFPPTFFTDYKPTPKTSNVSYAWNSPRNRKRSVAPSQAESPIFFAPAPSSHRETQEADTKYLLASPRRKINSLSKPTKKSDDRNGRSAKQKSRRTQQKMRKMLALSLSSTNSSSSNNSTISSNSSTEEIGLLTEPDLSSFERQLAFDVDVLEPDEDLTMKWKVVMEESAYCWERDYHQFESKVLGLDNDDTEPAYSTGMAVSDFEKHCAAYHFQRASDFQTNLSVLEEQSFEQAASVVSESSKKSSRSRKQK